MGIILSVALILFVSLTFVIYKLTNAKYKSESSEKMWTLGGMRANYWQGLIVVSSGLTVLIIYLLKAYNLISI